MSKLIIVESPAKCKKIESFLGSDYTCLASYGHITCLPSLKNINFENYKIDFEIAKEKSKQISKLRAALKKSNEVILATDDDREGEAIAYHLCSVLKLDHKTTKRIIFNEITKTALEKAIRTPTIINMDIVHAQNTRQILDLLIGFKFSPVLWEQISRNNQNSLSAGRCQTPALRIIYENQKEYDSQEPCEVYSTIGYFTSKNIPFVLNKDYDSENDVIYLSVNYYDEIWVIDHSTTLTESQGSNGGNYNKGGDLIYRFGNPNTYNSLGNKIFDKNHFPNLLEDNVEGDGNVLVYVNGNSTEQSIIYELEMPNNFNLLSNNNNEPNIVWSYSNVDLFSGKLCGAIRLSNGNTLITESDYGLWEVTPQGNIVWKYRKDEDANFIWRSYHYSPSGEVSQSLGLFED